MYISFSRVFIMLLTCAQSYLLLGTGNLKIPIKSENGSDDVVGQRGNKYSFILLYNSINKSSKFVAAILIPDNINMNVK